MAKPTTTVDVVEYVYGTNELLDRIYNPTQDGPVWIVQGNRGRRPILALTGEEALVEYKRNDVAEDVEELEMDC